MIVHDVNLINVLQADRRASLMADRTRPRSGRNAKASERRRLEGQER